MKNYINQVTENVQAEEGKILTEQFILQVYHHTPVSNKTLSQILGVPIPIITALKKEFIKLGLVVQHRGISITSLGTEFVETYLGFRGLKKDKLDQLLRNELTLHELLRSDYSTLVAIFEGRPSPDFALDQAHCTIKTSLKRCQLALNYHAIIGKQILCVGDDDLVSISIAFVLKHLYDHPDNITSKIRVVDIDKRYLDYIDAMAKQHQLPIECVHHNLRAPLPDQLLRTSDVFYTDPPYTLDGMQLFLSRGLSALKEEKGLPIFFSFANKSYDFSYEMLHLLDNMGLSVREIIPRFNHYEGAAILGNIGQMMVLNTSSYTKATIPSTETFDTLMYTREVREQKKKSS